MGQKRHQYKAAFKVKVALEAVNGEKTVAQIAGEFGVHPNQVWKWKDQLLELFSDQRKKREGARDELEAELFR